MSIKRLLVCIDVSEASQHAMNVALDLAKTENASLTALAVSPPYEGDLSLVGVHDLDRVMRESCDRALGQARSMASAKGVTVKTLCEKGDPGQVIADMAEGENADLVIMGIRNTSPMGRMLLGSVTARAVGLSRVDVLLVPHGAPLNLRRLVLATDGSRFSLQAAGKAVAMAKEHGGAIEALCVLDTPNEYLALAPQAAQELAESSRRNVDEVVALAQSAGVPAKGSVAEGDAAGEILAYAQQGGAGTVVIGSHGRTGLRRLLMGGVVEKVVCLSPLPVWIVIS